MRRYLMAPGFGDTQIKLHAKSAREGNPLHGDTLEIAVVG